MESRRVFSWLTLSARLPETPGFGDPTCHEFVRDIGDGWFSRSWGLLCRTKNQQDWKLKMIICKRGISSSEVLSSGSIYTAGYDHISHRKALLSRYFSFSPGGICYRSLEGKSLSLNSAWCISSSWFWPDKPLQRLGQKNHKCLRVSITEMSTRNDEAGRWRSIRPCQYLEPT